MRCELPPDKLPALVHLGLSLLVLAVYRQAGGHSFINFDDQFYVYRNPLVLRGLTWDGFSWAFTTFHASNWHPLTWLSHMLDAELFGPSPGWHHRMGMLYHLANTNLLFWVLWRMTGGLWESAVVAALFGVHPLHVESVAWASERKDVLSTLFFLLALGAYLRYVRKPGVFRYLSVGALFGFSLLSKPMLVTFPFVLLLLDYWPLGRMGAPGGSPGAGERFRIPWPLFREKLPFLAMSIASCAVTVAAQGAGHAINPLWRVPLESRLFNAAVSYGAYLWKTVWPSSLAVLYPLPETMGMGLRTLGWKAAASLLLVGGISFLAARQFRRRPYLLTGWLWYLGTLVPVIGLVQVGDQAMADRYTYVPLIGVFLAVTWAAFEFAGTRRHGRAALAAAVPAVVLSLAAAAWVQAGYWRDNVTLYTRSLAVTERNWRLWNNLGLAHLDLGRDEEALASLRKAVSIRPDLAGIWINIGWVHVKNGQYEEGISFYREALRIKPDYAEAWYDLGIGYEKSGRFPQAIEAYREATRLDPRYADAWNNLGAVHLKLGQDRRAAEYFRQALRAQPGHALAVKNLRAISR